MAMSPNSHSDGVLRLRLLSDGKALGDSAELLKVTIERALNRIPSARIELRDGDMPDQTFPLSDTDHFKPGRILTIQAGYGDEEETLFSGPVVKHSVQIHSGNDARLVVECRDAAVRMSVGRRNANYVDMKDSAIIESLAQAHGLSATVDATSVQNKELVQYYCSDWDFMLARAEANGLLVLVEDGALSVKAPDTGGSPVLTVSYGQDLFDFQGELDARFQYGHAQARAWDMKKQAVVQGEKAGPASLNEQGNLDSQALSKVIGLSCFDLQTGAPAPSETLSNWAKAQQLKSGLARLRGRLSFQGHAAARPGKLIELKGVGTRFSGLLFVSGVSHRIGDGDWISEVQFGLSPQWFTEQPDVLAPAASGLLPGIEGLHTGVVLKLDDDPEGEQRIKVSVPVMQAETDGVWARLLQLHASEGFGSFFVPEVGDEVVLGFFNNDPCYPVILGSLYSSKRKPPYALAAENDTKAIVTRCKHRIEFDEKDKVITITTPGKNKVVISDKDKSVLLQDQNDNKVELKPEGISLSSPKNIEIKAQGTMTLESTGKLSLKSTADVSVAGLNIGCEAQIGLTAKGSATAELSASGQTTVKGAMVMIN